ncbi:hypothetical protein ASF91_06525 [Rhizobium sp. Leaf155]|nr:hypothetical protein ASF91_06525 [Rhizobium sp. Leaf155]
MVMPPIGDQTSLDNEKFEDILIGGLGHMDAFLVDTWRTEMPMASEPALHFFWRKKQRRATRFTPNHTNPLV